MKTVTINAADAAQLLLDSGLLGEINRVVLHPRGLALSVQVDDNDRVVGFAGLLDYRDDPSGIWFDAEFRRELAAKLAAELAAYDTEHPPQEHRSGHRGTARVQERVTTMGWASQYIAALQEGKTISFRPHGSSMIPKIRSGELCTVEPVTDASTLKVGDVVLCRVGGSQYLHLVTAREGDRVRISNNHGHHNGWANPQAVYGKLVRVES